MAQLRKRMIDPEFFADDGIGELDPLTRLLFIGLWCMADKAGRLEDRPRYIAGVLFSYDKDIDLEGMLATLEAGELIRRYEVDGKRIIQIRSWSKYQSPHCREVESSLPEYPGSTANDNTPRCATFGNDNTPRPETFGNDADPGLHGSATLHPYSNSESESESPPTPPSGGDPCEAEEQPPSIPPRCGGKAAAARHRARDRARWGKPNGQSSVARVEIAGVPGWFALREPLEGAVVGYIRDGTEEIVDQEEFLARVAGEKTGAEVGV